MLIRVFEVLLLVRDRERTPARVFNHHGLSSVHVLRLGHPKAPQPLIVSDVVLPPMPEACEYVLAFLMLLLRHLVLVLIFVDVEVDGALAVIRDEMETRVLVL